MNDESTQAEQAADALVDMGDLQIIQKAHAYAKQWHGDQKYGDKPYIFHLEKVQSVLLWMGEDRPHMHAAALLHDSIEDTTVNYAAVDCVFGKEIAELVYAVTDELGRNRAERHAKTYPKIKAMPDAVRLKLADRIANVEYSVKTSNKRKLAMYAKEYDAFEKAVAPADVVSPHAKDFIAWGYLRGLLTDDAPFLREGA